MPSENKTPNLGLSQWQGNEYIKRQDFVEDNYKIDQGFENLKNKIGSLEDLATEEKSDLVGAINEIENTVKTHLADYSALGKIEYVYIPEGTQTRFDVPLRTSLFFVLTENNDNKTTIINVARFASGGLVYQTVVSGAEITIYTNADRSAVFLIPEFTVRGFVVRARQPI